MNDVKAVEVFLTGAKVGRMALTSVMTVAEKIGMNKQRARDMIQRINKQISMP